MIRNSLALIEFIPEAIAQGQISKKPSWSPVWCVCGPFCSTAIGAFPITFDPVFSDLAWALIFGLSASTLFILLIIPVAYYAMYNKKIL